MKILQICGYAAPYAGNFIKTLIGLSEDCRERGYETVFAFPENAREKEWCQQLERKYKVYYLPLEKARIKIETYRKIRKIYEENDISIAHSHFELYDMPTALMRKKNCKIFWHLHDSLDLIYSKSNLIYKFLWKIQYKYASNKVILLSVSEKAKEFAIKLGFNNRNAYFLPNGIDTDRIPKNELIKNTYDFLIFGWDFKRKGVDLVLEATKHIKRQDYSIGLVAGEEVWEKIEIEKYPTLIKQEAVENVGELYKKAKCFLHVSRSEGLSYALLEALYSGMIVICSDIEQNMFAKKFKNTVFVKNENAIEISQAMQEALEGKITVSQLEIEESRKLIEEKYSIKEWNRQILKWYFGK